jgi:hypothetical protein
VRTNKKCQFCPEGKTAVENAPQINGVPWINTDKPDCGVSEEFLIERAKKGSEPMARTKEEIESEMIGAYTIEDPRR